MRVRDLSQWLLLCTLAPYSASAAPEDKKSKSKPQAPCTLHSSNTGSFFDLAPISLHPAKPGSKAHKDQRTESWHAKGYDYPTNFTINVCAPVLEDLKDVVGVKRSMWGNVSAYYELHGKTYSIGQESSEPIFRGRKLILNYTDGSPCPAPNHRSRSLESRRESSKDNDKGKHGHGDDDDDDDDDDDNDHRGSKKSSSIRKSTLISFLCEKDPLAPKASLSFVGALNECAYFFELRSQAACGGAASDTEQSLGPGGVFGVIALIAILVYLVGGCVYQRTVMHARGWRQLPNYSMWAGIASFLRDIIIILTSTLTRLIPTSFSRRRGGYSHLSSSSSTSPPPSHASNGTAAAARGNARAGPTRSDAENRLIDNLDEEWDD